MDFKAHIETAWNLTLKHILPLIIMTLVMVIISGLSLGILAPVTLAGYMHSILLMLRDQREPKVQDLFSHMRLFFPLLGFAIVAVILTLIGFVLLMIPGIIIALAISFFCLYMIPLMTDQNLELMPAIKQSSSMVTKDKALEHIIVLIIFLGISWIGSFVVIGWLFTQPLATTFLISVYEETVNKGGGSSELTNMT
jgi:hypothetical protein